MLDKRALLKAAGTYLRQHPQELVRAARNATALRLGLPLAALRWLATELPGEKGPRDLLIEAAPPGVRVAMSLDLMKTPIRASFIVFIERLMLTPEELRIEMRLADVSLKVLDPAVDTPIAALLKSGALDLSKPGNLAAYMPKRPPMLVEAKDDRVVLDLMKHKKLSTDRARRIVSLLTPLVVVESVATAHDDHLDVGFKAFPDGVGEAIGAVRRVL